MKKHLHYEDVSAYIDYMILLILIHIRCICAAPRVTHQQQSTITKLQGLFCKQQVYNKFHFWPIN